MRLLCVCVSVRGQELCCWDFHMFFYNILRTNPAMVAWWLECLLDNLHALSMVGSNLREVWFINRSEVEISCSYSNSRTPGPKRGL